MKTRSVRDHRDIAAQAGSVSHRQTTFPESKHGIDIDGHIVIAHESIALDTGRYSASWRRVRNVYLGELVDSKIGDLPDRAVVPPRRARVAIPSPKEEVEKHFASVYLKLTLIGLVTNVIGSAYRTSLLISLLINLVVTVIGFLLLRRRWEQWL